MISPETLRYYPFFGGLDDDQLKAIAMIAEEVDFQGGETLFHAGDPAVDLYFLETGSVDLYYPVQETPSGGEPSGILVGEINPGEPFSISALIEPHILTSTARVSRPSRVIKINARKLRRLFKTNPRMAYLLTRRVARVALERLQATHTQLAAAWA